MAPVKLKGMSTMARVTIIADSTTDLSPKLLERYAIVTANLYVTLGEQTYKDRDIHPSQLFAWADKNKATPKTAAISQHDCMELFAPLLAQGQEIVYVGISSEMSASTPNALNAARELGSDKIAVIDSRSLSTGGGHLALLAAELAEKGYGAKEIESRLQDIIPKVRASFVLDTTLFLYRGGRCSALTMLGASALSIKPSIVVENDRMRPDVKFHGRIDKAITKYLDTRLPALQKADPKRVFITHSQAKPEIVQAVREKIESLNRFEEILETTAGSIVSSHCGPGTLGVLYLEEPVDHG